ncbi:hypothetical protein NQ314_009661 [Rhamnusium bicolor]|uniref:Uncharacterized protein n=1 Tax=Rhamnusium bicolor TaxID=1586634 RepID=A0AAV8XXW9_9CUCU|nr:hypothetical protein NQ314_009661 [Rhamnusium bicolor]
MSTEVNQVVMTPKMLQNLVAGVQQAIQGSTTTTTTVSKDGNFSNCTSRFDNKVNSNVEPFIDSIVIYKDCVDISEENALKGLPMLLNEPASTWWQGIKSSITTFEEALLALRHAYGYAKSPHQIYKELFSREQNEDEPTDIFISKCRALLSYLPKSPAVHESTQLDMVYARENHEQSQDSAKKYANLHQKESSFKVNDKVLVDTYALCKSKNSYTSKFAPRRDGPYQISKVVSPTTYQLVSTEDPTRDLGKYHVSALTPYKGDEDYPDPVRPLGKRGRPLKTAPIVMPIEDGRNT